MLGAIAGFVVGTVISRWWYERKLTTLRKGDKMLAMNMAITSRLPFR